MGVLVISFQVFGAGSVIPDGSGKTILARVAVTGGAREMTALKDGFDGQMRVTH